MTPHHQVRHTHTELLLIVSASICVPRTLMSSTWRCYCFQFPCVCVCFSLSWSLLNASCRLRMRTCVCGVLFYSVVCARMCVLMWREKYWTASKLLLMLGMAQATGYGTYPHWWGHHLTRLSRSCVCVCVTGGGDDIKQDISQQFITPKPLGQIMHKATVLCTVSRTDPEQTLIKW